MKRIKGIVLMMFCFIYCSAQVNIFSTVTDEKGNVVAGASVHLLNTDFFSQSDDSGYFTYPELPKGMYTLEISAVGFALTEKQVNIPLSGPVRITMISSACLLYTSDAA